MKYPKTTVVLSLIASLILFGCGGGASSDSVPGTPIPVVAVPQTIADCDPQPSNVIFRQLGDYAFLNNAWGIRSFPTYTGYTLCVNGTSVGAPVQTGVKGELIWNWPEFGEWTGAVKAFPSIRYRPNRRAFTPVQLSDIGNLTVSHDVTFDPATTGRYQTIYDFFVDKAGNKLDYGPHDFEIGIVVQSDWAITANLPNVIDTVTLSGIEFLVTKDRYMMADGTLASHTSFGFTPKSLPIAKASFQLKPFFDYLISKGHFTSSHYLSQIEFGSEQMYGKGKLTINNFSVNN